MSTEDEFTKAAELAKQGMPGGYYSPPSAPPAAVTPAPTGLVEDVKVDNEGEVISVPEAFKVPEAGPAPEITMRCIESNIVFGNPDAVNKIVKDMTESAAAQGLRIVEPPTTIVQQPTADPSFIIHPTSNESTVTEPSNHVIGLSVCNRDEITKLNFDIVPDTAKPKKTRRTPEQMAIDMAKEAEERAAKATALQLKKEAKEKERLEKEATKKALAEAAAQMKAKAEQASIEVVQKSSPVTNAEDMKADSIGPRSYNLVTKDQEYVPEDKVGSPCWQNKAVVEQDLTKALENVLDALSNDIFLLTAQAESTQHRINSLQASQCTVQYVLELMRDGHMNKTQLKEAMLKIVQGL